MDRGPQVRAVARAVQADQSATGDIHRQRPADLGDDVAVLTGVGLEPSSQSRDSRVYLRSKASATRLAVARSMPVVR
jgi:formaldehyde-activating enzyme involved in methanogenesis